MFTIQAMRTGMRAGLVSGAAVLLLALISCSNSTPKNPIGPNLTQISSDAFTAGPGQNATEVEPHVLSNGSTMVAAFQVGRVPQGSSLPGGSTDIGWATSTDGGNTWNHGVLPGLTTGEGSGPYDSVSDPVVAYDARHGVWLIASLPISITMAVPDVTISSSADGMTWQNPVAVTGSGNSDKNWIVCDNTATSPFYGNCYVEWDNPDASNELIYMSTSSDGGQTWGPALKTADSAGGIGGQPLVQPNGTVVVPIWLNAGSIGSFSSANGGASWAASVAITPIQFHKDLVGFRSDPLPSAAIDGAGTVWVVWSDCRFRSNCALNDLVYSTSPDGVNWSPVTRVPIDAVTSTVDHFIPGIGIDPTTSGASAHVGIHYYFFPQGACTISSCQLNVGFISSANGGTTWNQPATMAGPMQVSWLATSDIGLMAADYIATAFTSGVPHGVFAVASANNGSNFNEAIYTGQGLTITATGRQLSSANDRPLHKLSDPFEREIPERGLHPPQRRARRSAK